MGFRSWHSRVCVLRLQVGKCLAGAQDVCPALTSIWLSTQGNFGVARLLPEPTERPAAPWSTQREVPCFARVRGQRCPRGCLPFRARRAPCDPWSQSVSEGSSLPFPQPAPGVCDLERRFRPRATASAQAGWACPSSFLSPGPSLLARVSLQRRGHWQMRPSQHTGQKETLQPP